MFDRILKTVLITTTLLASSFCCCTVRVVAADEMPVGCCCQALSDSGSCPNERSEDEQHECPCSKQLNALARHDAAQLSPTVPQVQWTLQLSGHFASIFESSAEREHLLRWKLLPEPCELLTSGQQILLAHSVRRC